ncbi:Kanadaptin [Phytophthora ramorum]|uniref:Kanadaptin n=1 Tax=Phytophthora ramorum TaxID=164328 RepID=UPI0030ADCCCE|nr:Kanadaptin [Phytophthora ramorum]
MAQYSPPEWSSSGRNAFGIYLEVIKGGVVVEALQLPRSDGRSYVVAGRMETVCDLPLAHPSISRVHAALQFDEQGALFLYDMRSTHGCFVNKKRVLADEFVRLHIGDVLVFGESTRLYAVCGPPELLPAEYESLNLAKFRDRLEKKREVLEKNKQEGNKGASWGFGEDAEEEDESDEESPAESKEDLPDYLRNLKEEEDQPYTSSVSQSQVREKDQRLFQQLQTRIRKMENLKLERSRILAKQHQLDGLSEGQQHTLDRNEQRIDVLMKEIDDLEGRIHAKNDQRTKTIGASGAGARKKRNINEELYGYSSDEDDFYDRTKANQQKIAARKQKVTGSTAGPGVAAATKAPQAPKSEVLTVDSIQANVTVLEGVLAKLQRELTAASAKAASTEAAPDEGKHEEEVDSLDSFMAATTTQLHVSDVDTLLKRKAEAEMELKRQRQLLAVATPALAALPVQKPIAKTMREPAASNSSATSSDKSAPAETTATSPPNKAKTTQPATGVTSKKKDNYLPQPKLTPPETKNSPADKPKAPPASSGIHKSAEKAEAESSASKRRRISGPTLGPPRQVKPGTSGEQHADDASVLEGGDQVWVPPSNQTGDGRTKLNDKFGY